jgi:hypothetical protein
MGTVESILEGLHPVGERTLIRGDVVCLTVVGNRATVGIVTTFVAPEVPFSAVGLLYHVEDNGGAGQDRAGTTILESAPTSCPLEPQGTLTPIADGDIVVTDSQPVRRMVGKGAVTGGGQSASYAVNLGCTGRPVRGPFEVRFGNQRFRLLEASTVTCTDDPAVPTPASGWDTQSGSGTGSLTHGGPGIIQWKLVDGGAGGAQDRVAITIKNVSGQVLFQGTASPPGKFPGSTQPTGYNTAQLLP